MGIFVLQLLNKVLLRNAVAARRQVLKKNFFLNRPLRLVYSNILEVKFLLQVSGHLSVRLHLWRHFHYISQAQYFERDQFRINRLSVRWDLGMLRQKQYDLVIEKYPASRAMQRVYRSVRVSTWYQSKRYVRWRGQMTVAHTLTIGVVKIKFRCSLTYSDHWWLKQHSKASRNLIFICLPQCVWARARWRVCRRRSAGARIRLRACMWVCLCVFGHERVQARVLFTFLKNTEKKLLKKKKIMWFLHNLIII